MSGTQLYTRLGGEDSNLDYPDQNRADYQLSDPRLVGPVFWYRTTVQNRLLGPSGGF